MKRMHYGEVDLNLLFVLERVLSRQSITLAAQDLGLSQPATSRALQRLRDTLDDPLLVRAGREMVPTDRAKELLEPALAALSAAEAVFAPAPTFDPSSADGSFILAIGDDVQAAFGHAFFAGLRREAPGIDLRFRQIGSFTVEEGQRGLIDLAVAPDLSALPDIAGAPDLSAFVVQSVYTRTWSVVGSRRAWAGAPDLARYLRADHAIVSFEAGGRGFVDELLEARGLSRRVAATATSFSAVARLVAETDLLAVLPTELAWTFAEDLCAWPPPFDLPDLDMMLIWHPRQRRQGRHRFFRELVSQVMRQEIGRMQAQHGA